MADPTDTPHNDLAIQTFRDVGQATAMLRTTLPAEVVALFDWDALRLEPGSFVAVGERSRHCDLLFSLPRLDRQRNALVFVLTEHQSTDAIIMGLRLFGYMARIWEDWVAAGRGLPLPPILGVVLAHDPRGWRSGNRFHQLFEADADTLALLRRFIPDFEFIVDDLTGASNEDLAARALPPTGALTLWALRDGRSASSLLEHAPFWASIFELLAGLPDGQAVVDRIMRYLGRASGDQSVSLETLAQRLSEHGPKARQVIMDSVDKLREEGRKEGMQKGLQKGRVQGRADGQRLMLLRLLEAKFEGLTAEEIERVNAADVARLEQYIERFVAADSVAAVLCDE